MATKKPAKKPVTKTFVAMVGLNIGGNRYEAGDKVVDPPKWMIKQGKVV